LKALDIHTAEEELLSRDPKLDMVRLCFAEDLRWFLCAVAMVQEEQEGGVPVVSLFQVRSRMVEQARAISLRVPKDFYHYALQEVNESNSTDFFRMEELQNWVVIFRKCGILAPEASGGAESRQGLACRVARHVGSLQGLWEPGARDLVALCPPLESRQVLFALASSKCEIIKALLSFAHRDLLLDAEDS